jgi:5-methylcytosine-specific restriction protein B
MLAATSDADWHDSHPAPFSAELRDSMIRLHQTLYEVGWEFGFRTYHDVFRYAAFAAAISDCTHDQVLDAQVMQKVLPRLHGSRRRLEPVLARLGRFCTDLEVSDRSTIDHTLAYDPLLATGAAPRLLRSHGKIRRMFQALLANQFASFND